MTAVHAHHEAVNVALRDAFIAARRQLEEHALRMRGDVKRRPGSAAAESVERGSQAETGIE